MLKKILVLDGWQRKSIACQPASQPPPPLKQLQRASIKIVIIILMMMIIIIAVVFCKWYFKSYFCIRGCLLSTAPPPLFSHSPPSFVPMSFISLSSLNVEHASEMDLSLWTRSSSLFFFHTSPAVFSPLFPSHPRLCFFYIFKRMSFSTRQKIS